MAFNTETIRNVTINTGNILSLNDITKKPGQNPTEEVCEMTIHYFLHCK